MPTTTQNGVSLLLGKDFCESRLKKMLKIGRSDLAHMIYVKRKFSR